MYRGFLFLFSSLLLLLGACSAGLGSPCKAPSDCPAPLSCVKEKCACSEGLNLCGQECINLSIHRAHCGVCDKACPAGQTCVEGLCKGVTSCSSPLVVCGTTCVNLQLNLAHCGSCGQACGKTQRCEKGRCTDLCTSLTTPCGSSCVDLQTDPSNCGGCGNSCPTDQRCEKGRCVGLCAAPLSDCKKSCVDLQTDALHCGTCEKACDSGLFCSQGTCVASCPQETPSSCGGGCFDLQTASRHCGRCGASCEEGEVCASGQCATSCPKTTPTICFGGCFDLQTSTLHCGACGKACPLGSICQKGTCTCPPSSVLCDGSCVDPQIHPKHCGTCGNACPLGQVCTQGACSSSCPPATPADCFGGCFDLQTDPRHCGSCGNACAKGAACQAGKCSCPAEQTSCGGLCVNLRVTTQHCSACDLRCPAGTICKDGLCCDDLDFCDCPKDGITRPCYYGPPGTLGVGLCKAGIETCNRFYWSDCKDQYTPQEEGPGPDQKDNDCDGKVDEGLFAKVSTEAGELQGMPSMRDGPLTTAFLASPRALGWNGAGVLFFSDASTIRSIDGAGQVKTLAGSTSGFADGLGSSAKMRDPQGFAFHQDGSLYFADPSNHRIRKLDAAGLVSTIAGDGRCRYSGAANAYVDCYKDGPALQAQFSSPSALAFDSAGALYIADNGNHRIRKLDTSGQVTTFAGSGTSGFLDATGTSAQFKNPLTLVFHTDGILYVLDQGNSKIRSINPQGTVSTHASFSGQILSFAKDDQGQFFLVSSAHNLYKIDAAKQLTLVAGMSAVGFWEGQTPDVLFASPQGIAFHTSGELYIADSGNRRIRKLDKTGQITTFAGDSIAGWKDGPSTQARFYKPYGIVSDGAGGFFISDTRNNAIRKLDAQKVVTTVAGHPTRGYVDGVGNQARFRSPQGLAILNGEVYIADTDNHVIRKLDKSGRVTTIAGNGTPGFADGQGTSAAFSYPTGLAFDGKGDLYIADTDNYRIRKLDRNGLVTTFAGSGTPGTDDGPALTAKFSQPFSLAAASNGDIYVGDQGEGRLRKITTGGVVSTLSNPDIFADDEFGPVGQVYLSPLGLAFGPNGDLYISDHFFSRLRVLDTQGQISFAAGHSISGYLDGLAFEAKFEDLAGMVFSNGSLFIVDAGNHRIRSWTPSPP